MWTIVWIGSKQRHWLLPYYPALYLDQWSEWVHLLLLIVESSISIQQSETWSCLSLQKVIMKSIGHWKKKRNECQGPNWSNDGMHFFLVIMPLSLWLQFPIIKHIYLGYGAEKVSHRLLLCSNHPHHVSVSHSKIQCSSHLRFLYA